MAQNQLDPSEMKEKVRAIFPHAQFECDLDGQIIIYTDMMYVNAEQNPSLQEGEVLVIDYVPSDTIDS